MVGWQDLLDLKQVLGNSTHCTAMLLSVETAQNATRGFVALCRPVGLIKGVYPAKCNSMHISVVVTL